MEEKKEVVVEKKNEQLKPEKKKESKKIEKIENKKEKNKKEKGRKRGILARIVAIILVLAFVIGIISLAIPKPVRMLEEMFKELKAGNFEKVEQYVDYTELSNVSELETKENADKQKLLYDNLEWSIKKIEKGKDEVKVETEVTNKNFKTIIQNYTKKVIQNLFTSQDISMEDIEKYLEEELKNDKVDKITTTKVLTIKKQEGKWKVLVDDNLKEALYPGLQEALKLLTIDE